MAFDPTDLPLAEKYQFYKSLFDYHPDGVYVLDLQGCFITCNEATTTISGYQREELIGCPFMPLIAPEDIENVIDHFHRLVQGEPQNHELKFLHKDGHLLDLGITSMPIIINDQIVAVFGIGRDIGERKRAEAALRASEARTRLIIDTAHDAFVSIDENNRIIDWNHSAEEMFGWSRSEAIGQDVSGLIIPPASRQAHNSGVKRFLLCGSNGMVGKRVEVPALDRTGREFPAEVTVTSIQINGAYVFNAFFHDITQRKQAEEALKRSEERLRTITDNIPALIGYADAQGCYQFINKTFEEWFGLPHGEIQGRPICEILERAEYELAQPYIEKALSGQVVTYERKRGAWRDVQATYLPHLDENEKINGFYILVNDITERKQAEVQLHESQQMLRTIIDTIPQSIYWKDRYLNYLGCNTLFAQDAGMDTPDDIVGKSDFDLFPRNADRYRADDQIVLTTKQSRIGYEEAITNAQGGQVWLRTSKVPLYDTGKKIIGVLGVTENFTAQKLTELALQSSEEKFRITIEQCPVGITQVDLNGKWLHANPKMCEMTGYTLTELTNKTYQEITHPDDIAGQLEQVDRLLAGEIDSFSMEKRFIRKDGSFIWTHLTGSVILSASGSPQCLLGIIEDITARKEHAERLAYLAQYDSLTGLPNRSLLKDRLTQALRRAIRYNKQVALLFLDMDKFKDINDSFGHDTGDRVLVTLAGKIKNCVRDCDTVARLGGDEFIVILEEISQPDQAGLVAQKIIDHLSAPIRVEDMEFFLTASIGIALYPADDAGMDGLLQKGDIAMYAAKEKGRNNYQYFAPEMSARAIEILRMKNQLRHALERNELVLHYQPQVDFNAQKIVGVEALIRWQHPELGLLSPDRFIPLAEETGEILRIGEWVLQTACRQSKAWRDTGYPIKMAVNLSARQLKQPGIKSRIWQLVKDSGIVPHDLELEITEGLLIENITHSQAILADLHALGIRIALDDFGTGYSSLNYLKDLSFDILKIDGSFVKHLAAGTADAAKALAITRGIITMAHSLGLTVIAEGVETKEQLGHLRTMACDLIQGYLFSRPLPAEEITLLLAQSHMHQQKG